VILQAVGAHRGSENVEFDEKIREFNLHVNEIQRIREAMHIWSDAVDTFCAANVILADAFHRHFDSCRDEQSVPQSYRSIATAFKKIEYDINNVLRPTVKEVFYKRCIEPTESIVAMVPAINEQIHLRKQILLDFDSYNAKIQNDASAGRDPNMKTKAKLSKTTQELASVQESIKNSLREFNSAKPNMLGNELAAAVACIYHLSSTSAVNLAKILPFIPQTSSTLCILCSQSSKHKAQSLSSLRKSQQTQQNQQPQVSVATILSVISEQQEKLQRISSTSRPSEPEPELSVVRPIVSRSGFAGGKDGGYGVSSSVQYSAAIGADTDNFDIPPEPPVKDASD